MMRLVVALFLLVIGYATGEEQQKLPPALQPVAEELDRTVSRMVADPNAGAFTLGIVTRNGLAWSKSYGYADVSRKRPADGDSVYRVGSITKQFTALMLLQLVHDGKVHFSDLVEKYLPEIHLVKDEYKNAPPITLMQLATHTSGLDREPGDMETYVKGPVSEWEKTLISALPHAKYLYEPGTRFSYSNIGYAILGVALERAAHQPYVDYVKNRILLPLGMTHSDFLATPAIRQHLAAGYNPQPDGKLDSETPEREHDGRGYKVPNGALYTTVGDLARFEVFEMLGGPDSVLPRKEWEKNLTRLILTGPHLDDGYGVGFALTRESGHVFMGHNGGVAGYTAAAEVEPVVQVGIIILHNESNFDTQKLLQVFRQKLGGKTPPASHEAQ